MENVHSKNDKANSIIYFIGMGCFMKGWDMTRLEGKSKPTTLNNVIQSMLLKTKIK